MSPPLSSLGAQLGTHLLQAKVKLRFVWAGLPLKDPCRGPVVAAPGVEDEGTHLTIKKHLLTPLLYTVRPFLPLPLPGRRCCLELA